MSVYSFSNKCLGELIDKEIQLCMRYTSKQANIMSYNSDNKGTSEVPCVKSGERYLIQHLTYMGFKK